MTSDDRLDAIEASVRRNPVHFRIPNHIIIELVEEVRVLRRQMRSTSRELTNEVAGLLAVMLGVNGSHRFPKPAIEWGQRVVRENRLLFERSPDGSLVATVHAEEPEKIYFSNVHDPTNFDPVVPMPDHIVKPE